MQRKIILTQVICLWLGKTTEAKFHQVNLRLPLTRIHYYQNKQLQVKGILIPNTNLQLNSYPNTQLDLWCSDNLSFQCTTPNTWLTNWYTDPSTWLTPQHPFDCCSLFVATSHRNTNKIFNVRARDFTWLQNLKAYKKRSKNSFFYKRRLGFQKENLMNLSRIRFFFFHLLYIEA